MKCRNCAADLHLVLIDLGSAPLSNAYLTRITARRPEKWFPLRVLVCESCWLVQAEAYSRAAEIFNDEYAYFSSFSEAWLTHSERYATHITDELDLNAQSFVVEVASNDGYLLKHFVRGGVPCLGIEPTASTAAAARLAGVPTLEQFFGEALAQDIALDYGHADLIVGNNVFAHVPDPHDFLRGVQALLKEDGVATFEFPHLVNLIAFNQFDTIYHEHFAYLSLTATVDMAQRCGLTVFKVEDLATHGGSLRVYMQPMNSTRYLVDDSVIALLERERATGVFTRDFYSTLQTAANRVKNDLLHFLLEAHREGRQVAAYGAAAKGNTLLNYAGVRPDLLQYVVDRNPAKQGKFLPGSRIPIVAERQLEESKPDYILILPWNLRDEVMTQLDYCRSWGARFVTAVPELTISD
jgi:SAM-dependent methyltransferase